MASAAVAITTYRASGLTVMPRRVRILIVDPHQVVQEGLAAMVEREHDMTVVATASSAGEALEDARRYRPDVVTLDLVLPDMPGHNLVRRILKEYPETRLIAITSSHCKTDAQRALDAGLHGYLSKASPGSELIDAIRQVHKGRRVIPGPMPSEAARRKHV